MLLRLCLAFPACVVEQAPAWGALKRGVTLSYGTRARMLLLYVLGVFLNQILAWCSLSCSSCHRIPSRAARAGACADRRHDRLVCDLRFIFAVKALIKPIYGIALTVFYFDQRIRKEGFDIEWMMQQAGMLMTPSRPESMPDPGMIALPETRR